MYLQVASEMHHKSTKDHIFTLSSQNNYKSVKSEEDLYAEFVSYNNKESKTVMKYRESVWCSG